MEWQTTANQQRGSFSKKTFPKNQNLGKKDQPNNSKTQTYSRSSKNFSSKGIQYTFQQRSPTHGNKSQRKSPTNSSSNPSAYAAVKALKPAIDEQVSEADKFYDMCKYFSAKQALYKVSSQVEAVLAQSAQSASELNGFKIVQNGITIHDETFDESAKLAKQNFTFSYDNRFKPHSESALSFCPGSKLIPMPTFIEAQE